MGNSCFRKKQFEEVKLSDSAGRGKCNEIESFNNGSKIKWKLGDLVGEGRICKVYQCINTKTGELLVMKSYSVIRSSTNFIQTIRGIKKEVEIMKTLNHKNIIKLHQIENNFESVDLIMEYIPGGCLEEIIKKYGALEEDIVKSYLKQLCEVLGFLSGLGIVHNALIPKNIFISSEGIVKIKGFKYFSVVESDNKFIAKVTGDLSYLAPEVLSGNISKNSDVWTLGLVGIYMITGKNPLENLGRDSSSISKGLLSKGFEVKIPNCSEKLKHFLSACLKTDVNERAGIGELVSFEIFAGKIANFEYGDESMKASLSRTAELKSVIHEVDWE